MAVTINGDPRPGGTPTIPTSFITSGNLIDGAVTNVKLGDNAVTSSKITDGHVTTAKINDSAVTSAKIASGTIVDANISASASIAQSKISGLTTSLASKLDATGTAVNASKINGRTVFVQAAQPTANAIGDIWFQVTGL